MTLARFGLSLMAALAAATMLACGGKVTVDAASSGDGAGGTSGTDSTTSGQNGTTSHSGPGATGTTTTTGTGVPPATLCQQVCDAEQKQGCSIDPDCVQQCLNAFADAGECAPQLTVFAQCLLVTPFDNCDLASTCQTQFDAFEECVQNSGNCGPEQECSQGSDGSCSCSGLCGGSKVEASCNPTSSGAEACICAINGMQVGSCEDRFAPCDLSAGCCSSFW